MNEQRKSAQNLKYERPPAVESKWKGAPADLRNIDTHSYSTYSFFDETPIHINTGRKLPQKAL
jgi:hypothetical protein